MKKKTMIITLSVSTLAVGASVSFVMLNNPYLMRLTRATPETYEMTLDKDSEVVSEDHGYYHSVTIRNNEFDVIGYTPVSGKFGNIKRQGYNGVETYNGMVFNRALINNSLTLTVNFSGGHLYYVITDYLMENMDFDKAHEASSGVSINMDSKPYFILYADDDVDGVDIESITVTYECEGLIDGEMVYTKNSTMTSGGRSVASGSDIRDSYVEIQNQQTNANNCYSEGTYGGHPNNWYRWCGREFTTTGALPKKFELHTTIMGNISQTVYHHDNVADNYFHFAVWPEFSKNGVNPNNNGWIMMYAGNDNYEPLGHDSPDRINTDAYGDESYAGRFFTRYDYDNSLHEWRFLDPDTNNTADGSMTLRNAYEEYNLPYWHVVFAVDGNNYQIIINGFVIEESEIFETFDESTDVLHLWRWCMYSVNYGNSDRTGAASYKSVYTYPRLVNLDE